MIIKGAVKRYSSLFFIFIKFIFIYYLNSTKDIALSRFFIRKLDFFQ